MRHANGTKRGVIKPQLEVPAPAGDDFVNLLLKEYDYVSRSFLENEKLGETRVELFIKITSAVLGFLALISGPGIPLLGIKADPRFFLLGCAVLFLFGWLTLLRIIHRNNTTDRYKEQLRKIRAFFVPEDSPNRNVLPFNPYEESEPRIGKGLAPLFSLRNGGMAETVMLLNSFILSGAIISVLRLL